MPLAARTGVGPRTASHTCRTAERPANARGSVMEAWSEQQRRRRASLAVSGGDRHESCCDPFVDFAPSAEVTVAEDPDVDVLDRQKRPCDPPPEPSATGRVVWLPVHHSSVRRVAAVVEETGTCLVSPFADVATCVPPRMCPGDAADFAYVPVAMVLPTASPGSGPRPPPLRRPPRESPAEEAAAVDGTSTSAGGDSGDESDSRRGAAWRHPAEVPCGDDGDGGGESLWREADRYAGAAWSGSEYAKQRRRGTPSALVRSLRGLQMGSGAGSPPPSPRGSPVRAGKKRAPPADGSHGALPAVSHQPPLVLPPGFATTAWTAAPADATQPTLRTVSQPFSWAPVTDDAPPTGEAHHLLSSLDREVLHLFDDVVAVEALRLGARVAALFLCGAPTREEALALVHGELVGRIEQVVGPVLRGGLQGGPLELLLRVFSASATTCTTAGAPPSAATLLKLVVASNAHGLMHRFFPSIATGCFEELVRTVLGPLLTVQVSPRRLWRRRPPHRPKPPGEAVRMPAALREEVTALRAALLFLPLRRGSLPLSVMLSYGASHYLHRFVLLGDGGDDDDDGEIRGDGCGIDHYAYHDHDEDDDDVVDDGVAGPGAWWWASTARCRTSLYHALREVFAAAPALFQCNLVNDSEVESVLRRAVELAGSHLCRRPQIVPEAVPACSGATIDFFSDDGGSASAQHAGGAAAAAAAVSATTPRLLVCPGPFRAQNAAPALRVALRAAVVLLAWLAFRPDGVARRLMVEFLHPLLSLFPSRVDPDGSQVGGLSSWHLLRHAPRCTCAGRHRYGDGGDRARTPWHGGLLRARHDSGRAARGLPLRCRRCRHAVTHPVLRALRDVLDRFSPYQVHASSSRGATPRRSPLSQRACVPQRSPCRGRSSSSSDTSAATSTTTATNTTTTTATSRSGTTWSSRALPVFAVATRRGRGPPSSLLPSLNLRARGSRQSAQAVLEEGTWLRLWSVLATVEEDVRESCAVVGGSDGRWRGPR